MKETRKSCAKSADIYKDNVRRRHKVIPHKSKIYPRALR